MAALLTSDVREAVERSMLCCLATADESGQPNVSPKEIFAVADNEHIVVANVASPRSAKNVEVKEKACLSFIGIFVQKGFKVLGIATDVRPSEPTFSKWVEPLRAMAGDRFSIHSVFVVRATAVERITAPSYRYTLWRQRKNRKFSPRFAPMVLAEMVKMPNKGF